jgi:nucleotide-binding universal stress UspA family protein
MQCKSIITYCDSEADFEGRLMSAASLAKRFDAHLTIASLGYLADVPTYAYGEIPGSVLAEVFERARAEAESLTGHARKFLGEMETRGDAVAMVGGRGTLASALAGRARFADLIVLPPPGEASDEALAVQVMNEALFASDTAVLVWPAGAVQPAGAPAIVAWNGSREALRAVRLAMPYLAEAKVVQIVTVDSDESDDTGSDLAVFLTRHDVKVERIPLARSGPVSETLRQHIQAAEADLLVMGAYGHSRLRELVLGGVTRNVLDQPPCVTLMAH